MIGAAILAIVLIVLGAAYLITKETYSAKPQKKYGKIIAFALFGILAVVAVAGYLFVTHFK